MTDTNAPRMHPADLEILKRAMIEGSLRSEAPTGYDARVVREAFQDMVRESNLLSTRQIDERIDQAISDRLRLRVIPSAEDIRAVAKEVAQSVYREVIGPLEIDIRKFLTEEQIEKVVYNILSALGLPADDKEERKATKVTIEAILRGHKLRVRVGSSFLEEWTKALAQQLVGAGVIGGIIWAAIKGGAHP